MTDGQQNGLAGAVDRAENSFGELFVASSAADGFSSSVVMSTTLSRRASPRYGANYAISRAGMVQMTQRGYCSRLC
jgi:hypothetical protein